VKPRADRTAFPDRRCLASEEKKSGLKSFFGILCVPESAAANGEIFPGMPLVSFWQRLQSQRPHRYPRSIRASRNSIRRTGGADPGIPYIRPKPDSDTDPGSPFLHT
jgi:hypothetical protein